MTPPPVHADEPAVAGLPAGVKAVWDPAAAWHETTPTRERISINGLWRWQPATNDAAAVPPGAWGWFKVPGSWPGVSDYMQKESQTVFPHPAWKNPRLRDLTAAWYQREVTVPAGWAGRRVTLALETLNSFAAVYVDGARVGEIHFPGGDLDLTAACPAGSTHTVSLLVIAMPLKAVMMSYADSAHAREVRGGVERRGLCGDAWLVGTPAGPRVSDVRVATSVRRGEITFDAGLDALAPADTYRLRVQVTAGGKTLKTFTSDTFTGANLKAGRTTFTAAWKPDRLWDTNTPGNQQDAALTLEDAKGRAVDAAFPVRFGFREWWIEGRDLILNGTRVHCSAEPVDNTAISTLAASYPVCRETFARMKSVGFNAVYTHNYGTDPGTHLSFNEMLRAADDEGMLVFFSLPHFGNYEWKGADADATNGYARHAEAYIRIAQNHPSVVMYVMSHNGCGYEEDMNPDLLGNGHPPRNQWSAAGAAKALRAEAIAHAIDPSRVIYHHSGGDLAAMDTVNFYANHLPAQEMAEWLEPWAANGVKPVFLCEFGSPLSWDWTMYRGWFQGQREWGSAAVPWEFCVAEWNAQYLGDRAYRLEDAEQADLRWEAEQFRTTKGWHRWDYPAQVGSSRFTTWDPIFARTLTMQLRGLRTSGISGYCLWDDQLYWHARDGVDRARKEFPTDWVRLQRPGFSPDFVDGDRFESSRVSYERADWIATAAGEAILRNNRPLLGYLAGSATAFTSVEHIYAPGETVEKQAVVINDSRVREICAWRWAFAADPAAPVIPGLSLAAPLTGSGTSAVAPGGCVRTPIAIALPATLPAGRYTLSAAFRFGSGETQTDTLPVTVLAPDPQPAVPGRIAIFDPEGETTRLLAALGVTGRAVGADADLKDVDLLIVGRRALTLAGPAPDITRVRQGLKVVIFEQSAAVIERRFGFRVTEYGLRQAFPRVPDSPLLAGLSADDLRDWRGSATLVPPRATFTMEETHGPTVTWCGIPVTRPWRCGTQGCVASVLIEKPARGDFLAIVDGGFGLQYSPLLVQREGRGLVVFCQLDVTGRSTGDPAATRLVTNLLNHVMEAAAVTERRVVYTGEPGGAAWLASIGAAPQRYTGQPLPNDAVLVVGPHGGATLASHRDALAEWIKHGGPVLAIGATASELNAGLPVHVETRVQEHLACDVEPPAPASPLAGIGPGDLLDRSARPVPLVTGGDPRAAGDGVLAVAPLAHLVLCQLTPWSYGYAKNYGLKRTFRRTSVLVNRLLANLGGAGRTPLLERFHTPVRPDEKRWADGLYLDQPEEWDDPYRFFRW